jgi:hypothetical protein
MIKEGIQTRRRKQKSVNGISTPKAKYNKPGTLTKDAKECTSDSGLRHDLAKPPEDYDMRHETYSYGDLRLVHHSYPSAFEHHPRFSSHQQHQLEMTTNGFDAELYARAIVTSPHALTDSLAANNSMKNSDEQHLSMMTSASNN